MPRFLVYTHRNQTKEGLAHVEALRASGVQAFWRDTRGFAGDVETCDGVVTDDARVAQAHRARGIAVEPFTKAPAPTRRVTRGRSH